MLLFLFLIPGSSHVEVFCIWRNLHMMALLCFLRLFSCNNFPKKQLLQQSGKKLRFYISTDLTNVRISPPALAQAPLLVINISAPRQFHQRPQLLSPPFKDPLRLHPPRWLPNRRLFCHQFVSKNPGGKG